MAKIVASDRENACYFKESLHRHFGQLFMCLPILLKRGAIDIVKRHRAHRHVYACSHEWGPNW